VKVVASRQLKTTTDHINSQHDMMPTLSALPIPSPSSLSSPPTTKLMTKKHVNNGTFNFDDFKCKKTIDTASIANHDNGYNRQSLLSSTPSSTSQPSSIKRSIDNTSNSFNDNKHQRTGHTCYTSELNTSNISSDFSDMLWGGTNENTTNTNTTNTATETKLNSTITNNSISTKLKGFDTSDIANDEDW
jgi:hypothetical protein